MKVINCEQGSDEWRQARLGIPTASNFKFVLGSGKGRKDYLYRLASERTTGEVEESFKNKFMELGNQEEDEAISSYEIITGNDVDIVGVILNHGAGYSPDGLVGDDGLIEAKRRMGHIQIDMLMRSKMPSDITPQVQGGLWVSEREWCDYVSFHRGLPLGVVRVYRDEEYIRALNEKVQEFIEELLAVEAKIRAMI